MSKETRTFNPGDFLYKEGEQGNCAFMIQSGRVELLKNSHKGLLHVGFLGKGDLVGEIGVFDNGPRHTGARAQSLVKVQVIPRQDFLLMVESEPQSAIKIMTHMAKRLRDTNERLAVMETTHETPLEEDGRHVANPSLEAKTAAENSPQDNGEKALVPVELVDPPSIPEQHRPPATAFQRPTLLNRLINVFRGNHASRPRLRMVAISRLSPDPEYDQRNYLIETLGSLDGITVRPSHGDFPAVAEGMPARDLARSQLAAERADLLVWGGEDTDGRVIKLRFTAKTAPDMEQPGFFPSDAPLVLPADFDECWTPLLKGAVMAAAGRAFPMLPILAEQATPLAFQPPSALEPGERALMQTMVAHVAAQAGVAFSRDQLVDAAIQCYQAALPDLPRESQEDWTAIHQALGLLLVGRGEKNNDEVALRRATDVFRQALGSMNRKNDPLGWGNLHARLGGICFRIDMISGDAEALKESLTHYQSALRAFPRVRYPWRWADIMTAIGQVLQVYGDHLKSEDILRKAVDVCETALEVRTAHAAPLLYASTRNNMGSALFLLARHTKEPDYVRQAAEAFMDALRIHSISGSQGPLARTITKNLERAELALSRLETRRVVQPHWADEERPETSL